MTNIVGRCARCGEVMYRFKKGNRPSDIVLGAEVGLHVLVCAPERFDDMIRRHF